ncbi:hypothetical protein C0993_005373 [Termitomyces sp. T159_Od127]|nr:hypothetical protein C0993_005373 [Termitomyces sp. T159_Od127]
MLHFVPREIYQNNAFEPTYSFSYAITLSLSCIVSEIGAQTRTKDIIVATYVRRNLPGAISSRDINEHAEILQTRTDPDANPARRVPSLKSNATWSTLAQSALRVAASVSSSTTPNQPDITTAFDTSFDALALNLYQLSDLSVEPYIDPTTVCSSIDATTEDFPWFAGDFFPDIGDSTFAEDHGFHHTHGSDEQATDFDILLSPENIVDASPRTSAYQTLCMETPFSLFTDPTVQPSSSADLDLYLSLFFSAFCKQVPLVHAPTWTMEDKPLLLVRAMQACGALFVQNTASVAFIDEILSSSRDVLVSEIADNKFPE